MRKCIVFLGNRNVYSLLQDNVLILHNEFTSLEDLPKLLFRQEIDSLLFMCQGTLIPHITRDTKKIGIIYSEDQQYTVVLQKNDFTFLTELACFLKVKEAKVISFLDYLSDKYKNEKDIIIVCKYISDYALVYVKDGKVNYFARAPRSQLVNTIRRFKRQFHAPIVNLENEVRPHELKSVIANVGNVLEKQWFSLDYIPFCLENVGIPIFASRNVNNTDNEPKLGGEEVSEDKPVDLGVSDISLDSDEDDVDFTDDHPQRHKSRKSAPKLFNFVKVFQRDYDEIDPDKKTEILNIGDSLSTFVLILLAIIVISGILVVFFLKSSDTVLSNQITIAQEQLKSNNDITAYLNGDESKSPLNQVNDSYLLFSPDKALEVEYKSGSLSITLLSENNEEKAKNEEVLLSKYTITSQALMGHVKRGEKTLDKTKYIIVLREE